MITPVIGNVVPIRQTRNPRILVGRPKMELVWMGLKLARICCPMGLSPKATVFRYAPEY